MDAVTPRGSVLRSLRVAVERELPGASQNQHWLVRRNGGPAVLRRVAPRSTQGLSYEFTVLDELDRRGWPVPIALTEPIVADGYTWVVYRWLSGSSPDREDRAGQRERGRLLARLHDDLTDLVGLGQRAGWQMAQEVIADPALDDLLPNFEAAYPVEGHLLRWHADRARQVLAELPVRDAARTVVHGDLAPWNLLFEGDALTGVVDFDIVHLDLAVADFACSWRGRYDEVIAGYDELRPLSDLDRELLTPVFWAWLFIGVADALREILAGTATVDRLSWTTSKLALRSPAMGPLATPYPEST